MNPFALIISLVIYSFILFAEPLNWEFPKDHGIHPTYDTEWYYITGHLVDTNNELHGFQVTFFRHKLTKVPDNFSLWNSPHLYTAHFAFTNGRDETFNHYETMGRESYKIAKGMSGNMGIHINDWSLSMKGNIIFIDITTTDGQFKLKLESVKPITFHGTNGYSQKSASTDHFSYYYSFTRLKGSGSYQTSDNHLIFSDASAWMDREIFNQLLDNDQIGWDWFAIQLDDGSDIMAFRVRSETNGDYFSGTHIKPNGDTTKLSKKDFQLTILDTWKSPISDASYPIKWNVEIPKFKYSLIITARFNFQELKNTIPFPFYYWEGQSLVSGSHNGRAYMELVGY